MISALDSQLTLLKRETSRDGTFLTSFPEGKTCDNTRN